jgi:hypothetical protein
MEIATPQSFSRQAFILVRYSSGLMDQLEWSSDLPY